MLADACWLPRACMVHLQRGLLGAAVPLEGLGLPAISPQDVSVRFCGAAHTGNEEAAQMEEADWDRIEACIR